jgi:hypothetical protein
LLDLFGEIIAMSKVTELKSHLKRGGVYRRAELEQWSNSVDRHIGELVQTGSLEKVGPSLYYYPKKNIYGIEPPDNKTLVKKFLKDDRFLITSFNHYNGLGVGTTQLYNQVVVYNHNRTGEVKLGNKVFKFRKKRAFPVAASKEFLLVDLVNNLEDLAEDQSEVMERVYSTISELDRGALSNALKKYGSPKTKRLLAKVISS